MKEGNDKSVLVADLGRSGQGWLSYMLCYILNAQFIEPYDLLRGRKYSNSEHILGLTRGDLPGREKTNYAMVIKTHEYPVLEFNLTDKVICLCRDPRDAAVSFYNMHMVRGRNYHDRESILSDNKTIHYMKIAKRWRNYYQSWGSADCYRVRYEDLAMDAKKTLRGILAYLQADIDDKIIDKAIEEFKFERIAVRPRGQEDKNNLEFRKGIVGDHKNHFNKLELAIFKAICGKQAEKLGYIL